MQKKLIALAVAAAAAAPAFAQSNVTVYGIADAYWASVKKTDKDRYYAVNSAGLSGSRIGFKAVEDLGNGTSALAVIEYGFSIDDGNSAVSADSGLAARQKLVGLTGGWGTAVAGYAQTAGYDFACASTPFAGSALDPQKAVGAGLILSCSNNGRSPNALAYISPNFGGFTAAINHGRLTEGNSTTTNPFDGTSNKNKGDASATLLAGTYAAGPVTVNGVYSKVSDNDFALRLGTKSIKEFGLRGGFNAGFATFTASYQSKDVEGIDNKDTTFTLGAGVPVGAAGTVAVSYAATTLKESVGSSDNKKNSFAVAYLHALSKRTTVYAGFNSTNDKTRHPAIAAVPASATFVGSAAVAAKTDDIKTDTLAIGLRHSF